ncbi:MAG: hypothetical protein JW918_04885 [Anaerolineae bacterium]|nr:hypothetical protein [Anaerolineae bacterium]
MDKRFIRAISMGSALLALALGSVIIVTPTAAAAKWWADYFDNATLSGGPVLSRYDDASGVGINFNWGHGSPDSAIPNDNFSVRWMRDDVWFDGGTHRFTVVSDDGVRVWVGDQLVVDEWHDRSPSVIYVDRYIAAGTYRVQIEYYEHQGGALIGVGWERVVGGETWRGEYYGNRKLEGSPALMRDDNAIDFAWGTASPDPAVPADNFSVRWTRSVGFAAGTYRFFTSTDDGVRLFVDGNLLIDKWYDQKLPNTHTGDVYLAAGQHTVVVEYYEHGDQAHAHVWWKKGDGYTGWHGEYFDNPDLVGGPVLDREDAEVNFDWGVEPPVSWMPDDNFSVRWTRTVNFTAGYYRISVRADDGFRLWLDDGLLIDKWGDMDYELHYVDRIYLQGLHQIKLEYYEHTGLARVRLWWETAAALPATAVPPAPPGTLPVDEDDPWETSYFDNPDLKGEPVFTRIEKVIDHNWGWDSPGEGVPPDGFSARWTQPIYFEAGGYRFTTYSDDGIRLWVDGRLLIDSWQPMRGYRNATIWLSEGVHAVKVEYFEGTGTARVHVLWERLGP